MAWQRGERSVLDLIDDLEQQAEGLALRDRDAQVEDLRAGEYAEVGHAARWHASREFRVRVVLLGGTTLDAVVGRTGRDWALLVDDHGREWLVRHAAVLTARGLSPRATADPALSLHRRLSWRSVVTGLAERGEEVLLHLVDGSRVDGRLLRVGADFVELRSGESGPGTAPVVVPESAVAVAGARG